MRIIAIFLSLVLLAGSGLNAQQREIWLDADTANEVDDLFAITRALLQPDWKIHALCATQWQVSQWAIPDTMEASHRLNMMLVGMLERTDVKLYRGSHRRLFDWGDRQQYSQAAYELIQLVKKLPPEQKLDVVALGALTNVASAVLIDPSISDRIEVYWLGTSYDFEKQKAKQIDFNCVMDIQATDVLLSSSIPLHIIPVNVAARMQVTLDQATQDLAGKHPAADFLLKRWDEHYDSSLPRRVLWDLALIGAMIWEDRAEWVPVTGFENPNVKMVKDFDNDFFWNDFIGRF